MPNNIETRILKYKGKRFNPLTDLKSVIDDNGVSVDELMVTSEKTDKVIEDIEQSFINNALRKTEQKLEENEKLQVEKNLGLDKKFSDIDKKLALYKDSLFDASDLYNASSTGSPVTPLFKKELLEAIDSNKILFAFYRGEKNTLALAVFTFVNKINDSHILFTAFGNEYHYTLTLNTVTDMVESKRVQLGTASHRKYANEGNASIFNVGTDADNATIQEIFTDENGNVSVPSVGDVFVYYEEHPVLGRSIKDSAVVISSVESNSDWSILLHGNDLVDDYTVIHHIKLSFKTKGDMTTAQITKGYHNTIRPDELELNNMNVLFVNETGNSIFTINDGTPIEQIKPMFKNSLGNHMIPNIGDMFMDIDAEPDTGNVSITDSGIVYSKVNTINGFNIQILSNNAVDDFYINHVIKFVYNEKQGIDSLRCTNASHTVIDPSLIEQGKLTALYADVERLKGNSNMVMTELDKINGEVI